MRTPKNCNYKQKVNLQQNEKNATLRTYTLGNSAQCGKRIEAKKRLLPKTK